MQGPRPQLRCVPQLRWGHFRGKPPPHFVGPAFATHFLTFPVRQVSSVSVIYYFLVTKSSIFHKIVVSDALQKKLIANEQEQKEP
jgi:hypothetical protein